MSQNIGEKQKKYLFFEAYLKTFASVLPTASQTPPKDTHCTPFLWALQISHFWFWGVWVGSHNCFNTISERSLRSFLQWPCKKSGARFLWISVTFMGRLLMAISNWDIPMSCCLLQSPLPLGSVATTMKWIAEPMQLKKILPLCQLIFREARTPQRAHNTDPQTTVLPDGKGTGGAARTSRRVGTVWAHREKVNLDLWADQPLARLPSWLYSPLHRAWGSAMVTQHSLASHMKKQSNSSAM